MPDPQVPPEIAAALEKGNLIEAIKLLRQKGIGLAEAKGMIEALQRQAAASGGNVKVNVKTTMRTTAAPVRRAPAPRPAARPVAGHGETHLGPGQVPRGGNSAMAIALLVIAGLAIAAAIVSGLL